MQQTTAQQRKEGMVSFIKVPRGGHLFAFGPSLFMKSSQIGHVPATARLMCLGQHGSPWLGNLALPAFVEITKCDPHLYFFNS